jgi:o-succinylbenzoate synthase
VINDLLARAKPFSVELNTQFRSVTKRVGFIITGEHGFGEWAPFVDYEPKAAAKWLAAALEAADTPRQPLHQTQIPVNGIVPALAPHAASDWAAELVEIYQVNTLKIKVGDAQQLNRVKAIAERLPGITLRVDANGSYSEAEAVELIAEYEKLGVVVIEQPCQTLQQCQAVRGRGLLVAVDESIRLASTVDAKLISEIRAAADIAVLKPIPLGGSKPTLELAKKLDLPVIISGSLDTSIGLSFVTYVAGLMPTMPLPSGLGTSVLLKQDLVTQSLLPTAGSLEVKPPVLSEQLLQAAKERVSSVELENLTQRLIAAAAALSETIEVDK